MENSSYEWVFIFQQNPQTDLFQEFERTFSILKQMQESPNVCVLMLVPGYPMELNSSKIDFTAPLLYHMYKSKADGSTSSIFEPIANFNVINLVHEAELIKAFKFISSTFKAKHYAFFASDHGAGTYLALNNLKYKHLFVNDNALAALAIDDSKESQMVSYINETYPVSQYTFGDESTIIVSTKVTDGVQIILQESDKQVEQQQVISIGKAFKHVTGNKLALLGFDSCWCQMIENAYNIRNDVQYLIACQEEGPIAGFGAHKAIYNLMYKIEKFKGNNDYNISPADVAQLVCTYFYGQNFTDYLTGDATFRKMGVNVSAVETSGVEMFTTKLNELCNYLINKLTITETKKEYARLMANARAFVQDYMYDNNTEYDEDKAHYSYFGIDVSWLLDHILWCLNNGSLVDNELKIISLELQHILHTRVVLLNCKSNYIIYKEGLLPGERTQSFGTSIYFPPSINVWNEAIYHEPDKTSEDSIEFFKEVFWKKLLLTLLSETDFTDIFNKIIERKKQLWEDNPREVAKELLQLNKELLQKVDW
jgi:Clostripain family